MKFAPLVLSADAGYETASARGPGNEDAKNGGTWITFPNVADTSSGFSPCWRLLESACRWG